MAVRVVLVEPLYDINVGKVCRAMKNFGFSRLYLVNPQAALGAEAEKYAKHASDILRNAKVAREFEDAVKGCYPVIGTTSSFEKGSRDLVRLEPLSKAVKNWDFKNAAVVFGREDIGLSRETLLKCDLAVYIETSKKYESLNLSNAVAIVLYMLRRDKRAIAKQPLPDKRVMRKMLDCADLLVESASDELKNPEKCKKALRNILVRGKPSDEEARSVICVLKRVLKGKT
ncbi:MAG: RNA methyltransferase [Candidatus Micrarchaeota archaeon]|nr:RNA methyltransferase [Candidatus Micrarchaeota archaeon]